MVASILLAEDKPYTRVVVVCLLTDLLFVEK